MENQFNPARCVPILGGAAVSAKLDELEARIATLERMQKVRDALPTWLDVGDCIVTAKEKAFLSNAAPRTAQGVD